MWCHGAQSYRAFGTAAQYVTVPAGGGARVLATVRRPEQVQAARDFGASEVFLTSDPGVGERIRRLASEGVNRIVEVAFDVNAKLNSQILAGGGVIASHASGTTSPRFPYWPLAFVNATIRLLGSDDCHRSSNRAGCRRSHGLPS